ncbi:phage tail sheath subtilisin-like domain-containing protein [Erythrobacter ani]|uniref:Phage tail sheath subtilisin-like domain-containing protein n=1 Tax=Erythrobacter ani TaxID=2827235 RepID=A0ABS6SMN9_9SPHN|nr:phage tail sheath subtilisin-like domain-containing protein [Erythrobacter ani]MBV7266250.1 phage tail sheath subtilisin-like domain-containing protein [Erythrobacter ani]
MPEYLAPGVFVEEVERGPRPIEGVSTSTAGMVGMAERGPINRPIFISSVGEYERWFGGLLPLAEFSAPGDPDTAYCHLPSAVQGFFANGGKRVFVTRIIPEEAAAASGGLYDRGTSPGDTGTILLSRAGIGDGAAGSPLYVLDIAGVGAGDTVRVGDGSRAEYLNAAAAPAAAASHIPLNRPLARAHDTAANAVSVSVPPAIGAGPFTLDSAVAAGANVLEIDSPVDLVAEPTPFLVQLSNGGVVDIAAVFETPTALGGSLFRVVINESLSQSYAAGTQAELLASAAGSETLASDAGAGDLLTFATNDIPFGAGNVIEFEAGTPAHEVRLQGELTELDLATPLPMHAPARSALIHVDLNDDGAITAKALTSDIVVGARVIPIDDRVDLEVGQVIRIGVGLDEEFAEIIAIPGAGAPAPNAGTITLGAGVTLSHLSGATVQVQDTPAFPAAGHQSSFTLLNADTGASALLLAAGQGYAAGDGVMIRRPDGTLSHHRVDASNPAANTGEVTLVSGLERTHNAGEPMIERRLLIDVEALDLGSWGDRLRLSVGDDPTGLLAQATTTMLSPPLEIRLSTLTGVSAGTLLELSNPDTGGSVLVKVRSTDPSNGSVTLDTPGLDAAAQAALGPIGGPLNVRSREFSITVELLRRPDPAVPSRNDQVIDSETFSQLSLDARHENYFADVIGRIGGPLRLEDGRPEGQSTFIRVADTAPDDAATAAIREGPESLIDVLPSGRTRAARHAMRGGDDSIATMADAVYLGSDDPEPLNRTGLQSLRNIAQISMVAIPGATSTELQSGLINHCELMRYRFAVLDAATPGSSLADVMAQRLAFDTKYAALYYPWYSVPDPMPDNLAAVRDFHLPPCGHVMGIYARTDEQRGVHKAPANEVVRGITGLSRRVSKAEQELLNPSNICATRDFRPDGRSIRVWGARCLTSDSSHKYVPVRRLLIFLEQSIEIGLQYVTFEPNAPELWRRVSQTVANFLTDVWRDGALEGTKPEEAFFVKCDRTTMTQSQIDNGQLIIEVGVAPVKPAEFVIVRIGFMTASGED